MLAVFKVLFFVGSGITVISAVVSLLFGVIDFDVDFDLDLDIGDFDLGAFLPVSPSLMFMFCAVFGGLGWILIDKLPIAAVIAIAALTGYASVLVVNRFVVRPLKKISTIEAGGDSDYIGIPAKVSEKIFAGEYGRITFFYDGNTVTAPAKNTENESLECGTDVAVVAIEGQTFMVSAMDTKSTQGGKNSTPADK